MLCGILSPSSGSGHVLGVDIVAERERIRQNIGYLSQRFSFYEEMTTLENLQFFGVLYGLEGKTLAAAIDRVVHMAGISGKENELVKSLPVGMRQRLALAGALLHDPPVLFLDEPTSGVDPIRRRSFWEYMYALAESGKTVFVTTHYMEEAEHCNRIALIIGGKIIALDTPFNLKEHFEFDVYRLAVDNFVKAYELLQGVDFLKEAAIFGNEIHLICERGYPLQKAVTKLLRGAGFVKYTFEPITPTLEDVFVRRARG
jgi:ABC-2 type transport system ATP-binding protein